MGGPNPRLSSDYRVHAILTHAHITINRPVCVHILYTNKHALHTYKKILKHIYTHLIYTIKLETRQGSAHLCAQVCTCAWIHMSWKGADFWGGFSLLLKEWLASVSRRFSDQSSEEKGCTTYWGTFSSGHCASAIHMVLNGIAWTWGLFSPERKDKRLSR